MARTVELLIEAAFDQSDAVAGMADVGDAARDMGAAVDDASRTADAATDRMGSVAESADNLGSSTSQAAGGLGDLGGALSLMPGPLGAVGGGMEALAPAVMGVTGATDLLNLAANSNIVVTTRARAAAVAHRAATIAQAAASRIAAVGQWALNAAMTANPIGIVIALVAGLIAVIVIAYQRSERFRNIVDTAMNAAKAAFQSVKDKVSEIPETVGKIIDKVQGLAGPVQTAKEKVVGFFQDMASPIQAIVDLVQKIIDKIADIDFPDLPDIPFVRTAGRGEGLTTSSAGGVSGVSAGGVTLISLEVNNNLVGDATSLGRELIKVLRRAGVSIGDSVG